MIYLGEPFIEVCVSPILHLNAVIPLYHQICLLKYLYI